MSNLIRAALLALGTAMLVVPGGCSLLSTPALLASLGEPDPFRSSRPLIADTLLLWPLGFAIALGGLHLRQCARQRKLDLRPQRWLLASAGALLLMSAGSIAVLSALGYLPNMLASMEWRRQAGYYYYLATDYLEAFVLPLGALVFGIYLLALAVLRGDHQGHEAELPMPGAEALRLRTFPCATIALMIMGTFVVLLLLGLLAYGLLKTYGVEVLP